MTNDKTVTMSREKLRQEFEAANSDRAWFVQGGTSESDTPEGFVYGDFTTDMCWTCYFEARRVSAPVVERQEPVEALLLSDCVEHLHRSYGGGYFGTDVVMLYTSPPAPVAVVLPEPFAWYTEDYLTDKSATTYDMPTAERWKAKGWPVQPLYISTSIEPAKAFGKGFNTLEASGGKYKIIMQFAGHDDAWEAYTALSKMTACLDKVKEMNR